jgi:uncharacterized protein YwqG
MAGRQPESGVFYFYLSNHSYGGNQRKEQGETQGFAFNLNHDIMTTTHLIVHREVKQIS